MSAIFLQTARRSILPTRTWTRAATTSAASASSHVRPAESASTPRRSPRTSNVEGPTRLSNPGKSRLIKDIEIGKVIMSQLDGGKYQQAFGLYNRSLPHGFRPNRTVYRHMFQFLASIPEEDWPERQPVLYDARFLFIGYLGKLEGHGPLPSIVADYITMLGNAGHHLEAVNTFYALGSTMYADASTVKAALSVVFRWSSVTDGRAAASCAKRVASIWERIPSSVTVDAEMLEHSLPVLAGGQPAMRDFGVQLIRKWVDSSKVVPTLGLALQIARIFTEKAAYTEVIWWTKRLLSEQPETATNELVCEALHAYACQSAFNAVNLSPHALAILEKALALGLPPFKSSFSAAMLVTWVGGDWEAAKSVFKKMTGHSLVEFSEIFVRKFQPGSSSRPSDTDPISSTTTPSEDDSVDSNEHQDRQIHPHLRPAFTHLAQAALSSHSVANMIEFLRFIEHIDSAWARPSYNIRRDDLHARFTLVELAETVRVIAGKVAATNVNNGDALLANKLDLKASSTLDAVSHLPRVVPVVIQRVRLSLERAALKKSSASVPAEEHLDNLTLEVSSLL